MLTMRPTYIVLRLYKPGGIGGRGGRGGADGGGEERRGCSTFVTMCVVSRQLPIGRVGVRDGEGEHVGWNDTKMP